MLFQKNKEPEKIGVWDISLLCGKQNYQMSEEDNKEFSTPYRYTEEKDIQETAVKGGEESHVNPSEEAPREEEDELQAELDQIQEQIRKTEARLREIKQYKEKVDEQSEEFFNLQDERRILRKELIQLDYQHKKAFQLYRRRNQDMIKLKAEEDELRLQEQQERLKQEREQESLQRSRRLEQQLEDIKRESQKRRESLIKLNEERENRSYDKQNSSVIKETSVPQDSEIRQTKEEKKEEIKESEGAEGREVPREESPEPKSLEELEAEARHKARVAEIELELTTERLRRSRQVELQTELIRIRSEYPAYSWWRSYPYSYRLFPLPYELPPVHPYLRYPYYLDYPVAYPYRRYYPLI